MRVGFITNDQTENLVDTVIARQMLSELDVPVEEVVKGCFCCKFDELIAHVEKILAHDPDVLMGEPVGSCTDFVAAVANLGAIALENIRLYNAVQKDYETFRQEMLEWRAALGYEWMIGESSGLPEDKGPIIEPG